MNLISSKRFELYEIIYCYFLFRLDFYPIETTTKKVVLIRIRPIAAMAVSKEKFMCSEDPKEIIKHGSHLAY
ncbi:hypothetical protein EV05_1722 [Prochlorococcus sp. MIT 0601]|nr:hypothetical protein EV05_1722 [Prochlorococcus sp. MIT 0601]